MKKRIKRRAALLLAVILAAGNLSGCSAFENIRVVLTTGVSGDQLFKVGKSVCTLQEAMIYVMDYQQQYESVYGVEMWEHDFGGVTLEEYVKDTIVAQLASVKAITLLADDYDVKLDDAEKKRVKEASEEYYLALSQEQREYMDLKCEDVEDLCSAHLLAEKVYAEITKNVNTEVSDDEARIITVQQIRLDTAEAAQDVKQKLDEGKDFAAAASAYSKDSQITFTFGRGEHKEAYEEAAFALENDQISGVIEDEEGYYILKCVNNFDQEATEENKITMAEKRRNEVFGEAYDKLIAETPSEFHERLWEKVHFSNWTGEMPPNFMEIYEAYFGNQF